MANGERILLGGVQIDRVTMAEALVRIEDLAETGRGAFVVTPNADHIVKLQKDSGFREVYRHADLVLADGMPLIWAARFLGTPLPERVTGSDLFPRVCQMAAARDYGLFLLGGRPGAADRAGEILRERYPGLRIVGTYCPPFGFEHRPEENQKITALIRAAEPHILCVGLGAPKQEKWIFQYREAVGVPVSLGIGVTFEFVAGMVRRAPVWMQKTGLEWLYRLLMEPKRLWRRYLVDDPAFFYFIFKQKLGRNNVKNEG